jgi:hypothetical protein
MKYFTPERWMGLQHVDEEQAFYAAQADWQQTIKSYRKDLEDSLPLFSDQLRQFAQSECLHDATLLADWRGRSRLQILVRLEAPDQRLLLLIYSLIEPPIVLLSALPVAYRTEKPR